MPSVVHYKVDILSERKTVLKGNTNLVLDKSLLEAFVPSHP